MPSSLTSLFWISLCAVIAPLVAGLVPRRLVPEVVLLIIGGVLIGPFVLELAATDEAIEMLRELGLGMLFLLAGYEIEPEELTGRAGRRAMVTWIVCLALAMSVVGLIGLSEVINAEIAVAIALTSTALGTLLPILRDSGLLTTPLGTTVLRHGAYGELGPIVAIAVLLGTHGPLASLLLLAAFAVIALVVSLPSVHLRDRASRIVDLIRLGSETTGQTTVRLTILLLVTLGAVAAVFELDSVLAAFAAGFVLRRALPGGDERLEAKLDGLAFGFLIPVFFVTSGMAIDPGAVAEEPADLAIFVLLILLIRGGSVYVAARLDRSADGTRRRRRESVQIGLYGATGLPIIVAVTSVAVKSGQMSSTNASVLVAGGAITVLLFPMFAALLSGARGQDHQERTTEPMH
ncbi:MAG: cation:proton antiporter [Nocardioidaceae bacterium]